MNFWEETIVVPVQENAHLEYKVILNHKGKV